MACVSLPADTASAESGDNPPNPHLRNDTTKDMKDLPLSEISRDENEHPEKYSEGSDKNSSTSGQSCESDDVYYSMGGERSNNESIGIYYGDGRVVSEAFSSGGSVSSNGYYTSGDASPADTWGNNNGIITPKRPRNVVLT